MEQGGKKSLNDMLETASKKLGTDPEKLKEMASKGNINEILGNLGTDKAKEISDILSDKNKASKILSSPKAKQLLQKFFGGK